MVSDTHSFGSGLLHEVRVSNARQGFPFVVASFGGDWPQQLGLPANVPADTFPIINNGLAPFNTGTAGQRDSSTWQFFDMLTWVKGAHTLKFGADIRHQQALNLQRQQPSGNFNFPAGLPATHRVRRARAPASRRSCWARSALRPPPRTWPRITPRTR